jgi:uncharacterized phage protein gp47/JayE
MFSIPTLGELAERVRNSFRAELPGSDAHHWPNNLNPTGKVFAGAMFGIYLRLDFVARQIFAATAEAGWLDRHGLEFGMSRLAASKAAGTVTFTSAGALTVAPGAIVQRSDGAQFLTASGGTLASAGTLSLPVVAAAAGQAGTTLAGATLTTVANVVGTATVAVDAGGLVGGADAESDTAFRARILFRKRFPPHGGSAPDFVMWASSIAGVTRVYVNRLWSGAGTVRVYPLTDGATASGIPSAAKLSEVEAYIDLVAPAGADVTVSAPTAVQIDVIIQGLSPDTTAVREAVRAELRDTFQRLSKVSGSDTPHPAMPWLATPQTFSRSWVWQAVANATGEERHVILQPSADVVIAAGSMAVLGSVDFLA